MTTRTRKPKTATLVWRGITCRVKHTPGYFDDRDMIEITVVKPKGESLPITETGYRCEFATPEAIATAGSAVAYMTALIDAEARTRRWQHKDFERRQLRLFD
jgi:hypothetical protein